jgi:hypothetical protein
MHLISWIRHRGSKQEGRATCLCIARHKTGSGEDLIIYDIGMVYDVYLDDKLPCLLQELQYSWANGG